MKNNTASNNNYQTSFNTNLTSPTDSNPSIIYGSLLTGNSKREISRITRKVKNSLCVQMSG